VNTPHPNPRSDDEFGSAEALRAEVNLLRTRLANVKQAKSRLFARIIASADLLDRPFSNAPDQSPWTRLKRDMHALNAALREGADPAHAYISTACLHEEHEKCRLTCKFCEAPCGCLHHTVIEVAS
jgi:hypothetical protein